MLHIYNITYVYLLHHYFVSLVTMLHYNIVTLLLYYLLYNIFSYVVNIII